MSTFTMYRCRLCNEVFRSDKVEGRTADSAIRSACASWDDFTNSLVQEFSPATQNIETIVKKRVKHHCADSRVGVADFAGWEAA